MAATFARTRQIVSRYTPRIYDISRPSAKRRLLDDRERFLYTEYQKLLSVSGQNGGNFALVHIPTPLSPLQQQQLRCAFSKQTCTMDIPAMDTTVEMKMGLRFLKGDVMRNLIMQSVDTRPHLQSLLPLLQGRATFITWPILTTSAATQNDGEARWKDWTSVQIACRQMVPLHFLDTLQRLSLAATGSDVKRKKSQLVIPAEMHVLGGVVDGGKFALSRDQLWALKDRLSNTGATYPHMALLGTALQATGTQLVTTLSRSTGSDLACLLQQHVDTQQKQ